MNRIIYKHIIVAATWMLYVLAAPQLLCAQDTDSGKPSRIWAVKIEGNETYSDLVIKDYISNDSPTLWEKMTFFNEKAYYLNESEIRRDEIRIQRFYNRRGFNDVIVTSRLESRRKDWKKVLIFEVQEGRPIRIDNVMYSIEGGEKDIQRIEAESGYQRELRRSPYRRGTRYESVASAEVEGRLTGVLRGMGYPYASTEVQARVDTLSKRAEVEITLRPGPLARFDSILVDGESLLDEHYIIRETGISKGQIYSDNAVRNAQREVYNHHLFRFALVSIPEQEQDSTVNLEIRVRELSPRAIELKAGVGNFDRFFADKANNRISYGNFYRLFRTQASWTHRNVRDKGERFTASVALAGYEQRMGMDYLFPYVFNTKSNVLMGPFVQHKDEQAYRIFSTGFSSSLIYLYNQNLNTTLSYDYNINNESIKDEFEGSPDSVLNYDISSFTLNAYYTNRLREGRTGWIIQPYLELSGIFNEASYSFEKMSLEVRKYTEISNSLVLATRAQGGLIFFSRNDSLPADIRFYTGGPNSVRGYSRQQLGPKKPSFKIDEKEDSPTFGETIFTGYVPLGGKSMLNFNVELRQELNSFVKGFGIAAFLDGGQVWRSMPNTNEREIQYGVGGGLRYRSPIGPIRVDLGYKLNPTDDDLGLYPGSDNQGSRWRLNFSIGQAF